MRDERKPGALLDIVGELPGEGTVRVWQHFGGVTLTQREEQVEGACLVFAGLQSLNSLMFEGRGGGKGRRFHKERWMTLRGALECCGLCWVGVRPQAGCCPAVFSR